MKDIKDARINVGPPGGSAALSAVTIYRLQFGGPAPDKNLSFHGHEEALVKLITDRTVDVVVFSAPQPARLLINMKAEARRFVKLLRIDANNPDSKSIRRMYDATTMRAVNYPNLLSEDIPGLSNRIYLVAYGHRHSDDELLKRFSRSWCQNLPRLLVEGHPKWREIDPVLAELKQGWKYALPVVQEMMRCTGKTMPAQICSQHERVLGLCD